MSNGPLVYAARLGAEAAARHRDGLPAGKCPWNPHDPSLTKARLATAWFTAFDAMMPKWKDLPE